MTFSRHGVDQSSDMCYRSVAHCLRKVLRRCLRPSCFLVRCNSLHVHISMYCIYIYTHTYNYSIFHVCIYIYICVCIYIYIYSVAPPPIDPCFLASTTYSGRIPSASHEKSSLCVQGYITAFSHTRGRAPLNVHAAPKFLGHLGQQFQKFQKSFKFETQPQIED